MTICVTAQARIARDTGRPPLIDYAPLKPEAMTPRRMAVQVRSRLRGLQVSLFLLIFINFECLGQKSQMV